MKIDWPDERCIICLSKSQLCEEHIIPQSIGGKLAFSNLCRSCNSRIGHQVEAAIRSDPSVTLALKNLSGSISEHVRLDNSQRYIGQSPRGDVSGYVKNGEFRVRSTKLDDGSIIQPTSDAAESIEVILKRAGYGDGPIASALAKFQAAPENETIEIAPGLVVAKWTVETIHLDLTASAPMNPLIPVKIAFEFLAGHVGSAICEEGKPLEAIRKMLRTESIDPRIVRVDALTSNKYEPFHGIYFEGNKPTATVLIRLFGWLAFRVVFLHLTIDGPRLVYTHRLDTDAEYMNVVD